MKLCLAVLFASLAVLASGQTEPWCGCGLFASSRHTEYMVYGLPEITIDNCESHDQCRDRCTNEFRELTNDLDLWSTVDSNGTTVGDVICKDLKEHFMFYIHNSYVHAYYEMCGGPWEYAELDSQQMLCCSNGKHKHCIS